MFRDGVPIPIKDVEVRKGIFGVRRVEVTRPFRRSSPESWDARRRVRDIIAEPMIVQGMSNRAALAEVPRLMETVQLDPARAGRSIPNA